MIRTSSIAGFWRTVSGVAVVCWNDELDMAVVLTSKAFIPFAGSIGYVWLTLRNADELSTV